MLSFIGIPPYISELIAHCQMSLSVFTSFEIAILMSWSNICNDGLLDQLSEFIQRPNLLFY